MDKLKKQIERKLKCLLKKLKYTDSEDWENIKHLISEIQTLEWVLKKIKEYGCKNF